MNTRVFNPSGAAKLDAPERLNWLPPAEVLAHLSPQFGETVADVGAGTGYFALPIANAVGSTGHVFAVDSQPEMLALLQKKIINEDSLRNIELVTGTADKTTLANASVDLVLLANVWHELDDQSAALHEARRILKSSGRLAILDWRTDVISPPGPPLDHRIPASSVEETLRTHNWEGAASVNVGGYSYLVIATPSK